MQTIRVNYPKPEISENDWQICEGHPNVELLWSQEMSLELPEREGWVNFEYSDSSNAIMFVRKVDGEYEVS